MDTDAGSAGHGFMSADVADAVQSADTEVLENTYPRPSVFHGKSPQSWRFLGGGYPRDPGPGRRTHPGGRPHMPCVIGWKPGIIRATFGQDAKRVSPMRQVLNDIEAGKVTEELQRRGIPPGQHLRVVVETIEPKEPSITAMNAAGGAFDWLALEPDLYSDDDLVERFRP
jgi:hypothetical protein